jgi:zinc transporter
MVSLRLWIDEHRVISLRARKLMAVSHIREMLAAGQGPGGTGQFLTEVAIQLLERMWHTIQHLDDQTDKLEDEMLLTESRDIRHCLADLRHEAIVPRRYLAPRRDAMTRLQTEEVPWIDARLKARLREGADQLLRYIEDLDSIRERASVIQDELIMRVSDQMNRTVYVLTVVATIMPPLGFLTGLLGINVGGIPLAESRWGFLAVCGILAAIVGVQVLLFRKLRWI